MDWYLLICIIAPLLILTIKLQRVKYIWHRTNPNFAHKSTYSANHYKYNYVLNMLAKNSKQTNSVIYDNRDVHGSTELKI